MSVLIPVLNEGAHIREVVAAMQEQRYGGGEIEFIFADGLSDDDTVAQLEELAREDSRIKLIENPRRGTASGLNACLRVARGEHVVRMDAHTLYPPDYISLGVERLERGGVAWVAGPQVPVAEGLVGSTVAAALGTWLGRGGSRKWESSESETAGGEHDLDTGVFCGVWRRSELLEIGGFDEGWPRNQDSELAARFLRSGRRIVCLPAMRASYRPRDSLIALWRQYKGYGEYRAKTARRHPTSLRRSAVLPPLLLLDAVVAVAGRPPARSAARAALRAYVLALLLASCELALRGKRREAVLLPLVLGTMHAAHGVGFVEGAARSGMPVAALLRIAGLRRDGGDEKPYEGSVCAPTLEG